MERKFGRTNRNPSVNRAFLTEDYEYGFNAGREDPESAVRLTIYLRVAKITPALSFYSHRT